MGLYEKMYNVMCDSEAVAKDLTVGSKPSSSYKAVSEAAVLNGVKPLLKKYKLIIFPVDVDIEDGFREFEGKYGTSQRFNAIVRAKYKIVDIESGENEILSTVGFGVDSQDKGSGKAMTYAYKALLQKTFMLFSGEDTDNTHSEDLQQQNSVNKKADTETRTDDTPTKVSVQQLTAAMAKKGITQEQIFETYKRDVKDIVEVKKKTCTDLKFLPQEYKLKYFNMCK